MSEFCPHGFSDRRRCPRCGDGPEGAARRHGTGPEGTARSVYEDRPVAEVVDEEWRAEQLRSIGIPTGWRPLGEFLQDRQ